MPSPIAHNHNHNIILYSAMYNTREFMTTVYTHINAPSFHIPSPFVCSITSIYVVILCFLRLCVWHNYTYGTVVVAQKQTHDQYLLRHPCSTSTTQHIPHFLHKHMLLTIYYKTHTTQLAQAQVDIRRAG